MALVPTHGLTLFYHLAETLGPRARLGDRFGIVAVLAAQLVPPCDAVRRKLILEIAAIPPRLQPADWGPAPDYDCLIGEKIWEENRGRWGLP